MILDEAWPPEPQQELDKHYRQTPRGIFTDDAVFRPLSFFHRRKVEPRTSDD